MRLGVKASFVAVPGLGTSRNKRLWARRDVVSRCGKAVCSGEMYEVGVVVELKCRCWEIAILTMEEGWKGELKLWC